MWADGQCNVRMAESPNKTWLVQLLEPKEYAPFFKGSMRALQVRRGNSCKHEERSLSGMLMAVTMAKLTIIVRQWLSLSH